MLDAIRLRYAGCRAILSSPNCLRDLKSFACIALQCLALLRDGGLGKGGKRMTRYQQLMCPSDYVKSLYIGTFLDCNHRGSVPSKLQMMANSEPFLALLNGNSELVSVQPFINPLKTSAVPTKEGRWSSNKNYCSGSDLKPGNDRNTQLR